MWLGHHTPAITLATYVHRLPDDRPDPAFLDGINGGNSGQRKPPKPTEIRCSGSTIESGDLRQKASPRFGRSSRSSATSNPRVAGSNPAGRASGSVPRAEVRRHDRDVEHERLELPLADTLP